MENQCFNVLDRNENIHKNRLLEASAGTGKTFSIENMVVRLLIGGKKEDKLYSLQDILVVTFTRAATRELKQRIRNNIENAIQSLAQFLQSGEVEEGAKDYISAICELSEADVTKAKRRLEYALFSYDEAQIMTIHGFCFKMLQEQTFEGGLSLNREELEDFPLERLLNVGRDFYRSGLSEEVVSSQQLTIVLGQYQQDPNKLLNALVYEGGSPSKIDGGRDFVELFNEIRSALLHLKVTDVKQLKDDILVLAKDFKGNCDRKGEFLNSFLRQLDFSLSLLNREDYRFSDVNSLLREGCVFTDALDPSKVKAKTKINHSELKSWEFISELRETLLPLLKEARNPRNIYACLVRHCQKHILRVMGEEEDFTPDSLLHLMYQSSANKQFVDSIREKYSAAIIDEFQDTDPLQWEIFHRLFLKGISDWGPLILVGDPKQSIYAFRRADIYTYLRAADVLGKDARATLATNFRSKPQLVSALNALFCHPSTYSLMQLPRLNSVLPIQKVEAGRELQENAYEDGRGDCHFFIGKGSIGRGSHWPSTEVEEKQFLPFITQEILNLNHSAKLSFGSFAVLVRDRYQAERVRSFLAQFKIPSITKRSSSLVETSAFEALEELMDALLDLSNGSKVRLALSGKLISWTREMILDFYESENTTVVYERFSQLRKLLVEEGFASFFQSLLEGRWHKDSLSVAERLLYQDFGNEFLAALQQIAELMIERVNTHQSILEEIPKVFQLMKRWHDNDDEKVKFRQDGDSNAVNILTLHVSKGLEFDIVFALGLANRVFKKQTLISVAFSEIEERKVPCDENSEDYKVFCQEQDAEKMRQLYVAMTRAKERLYVPVAIEESSRPPVIGSASPMDLFLSRLGYEGSDLSYEESYAHIGKEHGHSLVSFIESLPGDCHIAYTLLNEERVIPPAGQCSQAPSLNPPQSVTVPGTKKSLLSFTSISKPHKNHSEKFSGEQAQRDLLALPAGSQVGVLLHSIFEDVPWGTASKASSPDELLPFVQAQLLATVLEGWEPVVAECVWNAFHCELLPGLTLSKVSERKNYREMEFLYPYGKGRPVPGLSFEGDCYLRGVMDLVFESEGKVYLLDWKSNQLGMDKEAYHRDALKKIMEENDYFLQAGIYKEALRRYLNTYEGRSFDEVFGGTYYVFLRGFRPEWGPSYGNYFIPNQR